ncbi:MAG: CoA pyrophosphatase [Crocinitomicaceae bacterium]|nr:CoA pyrophosphatase [Crocinitomicaceae bacterium]
MNSALFREQFVAATSSGLPGEEAHSTLMPINRPFTSSALQSNPEYRKSAVGILLYPTGETMNSVLIQRPDYKGVHGNQVSFPGGKMDPDDNNLEYTARRECFEEVNLPLGIGTAIGTLSEVYIPVSKFLVQPYVLTLDETPDLSPDTYEVESIIHFNIFQLLDDSILKTTDIKLQQGFVRKNVPYFDINGHVVWGATAMMLAEFKAILKKF